MPWIASRIPGAKVIMIHARHFVHLEKPVEFHAAVSTFLEEVDGAS
jgi:pimeloyl-ACP methyl ester carboxylesterase